MSATQFAVPAGLPETVSLALRIVLARAIAGFGSNLESVVLYGSAAEGRLRATSDVNVIFVLRQWQQSQADVFREPLRTAEAAIKLRAMFLLHSEVLPAAIAFAQKFTDVIHRHKVLYGSNPFAELQIPRASKIIRLKQVLLNATLRMREIYMSRSQREEQVTLSIAEFAGALRPAAATLLELEGRGEKLAPKEALELVARESKELDSTAATEALRHLSTARETGALPAGVAPATLLQLIELARVMSVRAEKLA